MNVEVGNIVKFDCSGDKRQYRVKKTFNVKALLEELSEDYRFIEETMTKDLTRVFMEELITYLVKNEYVELIDNPTRVITLCALFDSLAPNFQASYTDTEGDVLTGRIKLNLMNMQSGRYTSSCEWRVAPNQETV